MTVSTLGEVAAQEDSQARPIDWPRLGLTTVQLGLIALVVGAFDFENRALYHILLFATAGFVVHATLPLRWRLRCFALLSIASVFLALHVAGLWLLALGGLLILLCHLPVRWEARVALVLVAGLTLSVARAGAWGAAVPLVVWPVLAGMFMFRLALYLYSLKHAEAPTDLWGTVAYFFLLPNAAFALFPIVDYRTFLKSHYDAPESAIYSRGIKWMVRGVYHLVLYRLIYHYLVIDPAQVQTLSDVVRYAVQAYLLYLRVSGQFHLIVGLMHLFGFWLPETNHLYFLASSFTGLWRRINIYWKDFMMKLVYYPSFFRLRSYGNRTAVLTGTALVMVLTWLLHAYQKFWVLGGNPFSVIDTLFWGAITLLVLASTLYELRPAASKARVRKGYDLRKALGTVMVFTTIALLFAAWGAESVGEFLRTLGQARHVDLAGVLLLLGLLGLGVAVGGWTWGTAALHDLKPKARPLAQDLRTAAGHFALLGTLLMLPHPLAHGLAGEGLGSILATISTDQLNARDERTLVRGYYEDLSNVDRLQGTLSRERAEVPADWLNLEQTAAFRYRSDFLAEELVPGVSITFRRVPFTVNSHGFHDQEYSLAKPAQTYRIAVLGASPVMAPGVADGQAFESVLERRLNAELGISGYRYEVLNFGMWGHSFVQQVELLRDRVVAFQPDLVVLASQPADRLPLSRHLRIVLQRGITIPYPSLRARVEAAGLDSASDKVTIGRALEYVADSVLISSVERADSVVRAAGARGAVVILRIPNFAQTDERPVVRRAETLGWSIFDLSDPFGKAPEGEFQLGSWDRHFNDRGNELIGNLLFAELVRQAPALGLPLPDGAAPPADPLTR